jgi:hypothetical protein
MAPLLDGSRRKRKPKSAPTLILGIGLYGEPKKSLRGRNSAELAFNRASVIFNPVEMEALHGWEFL